MPPTRFINVPFLATFLLYSWQHCGIDPARHGIKVATGWMTAAAIGALGDPHCGRHRGRVWRVSCVSVASFAGAYCPLRRLAPRETG